MIRGCPSELRPPIVTQSGEPFDDTTVERRDEHSFVSNVGRGPSPGRGSSTVASGILLVASAARGRRPGRGDAARSRPAPKRQEGAPPRGGAPSEAYAQRPVARVTAWGTGSARWTRTRC